MILSTYYKAALLSLALALVGQSALAQGFINKKQDLPDASRFYMSRMQIQVTDDSPIINHQMNSPGQQGGNAGIPGVPPGLPRAGFQSYTPATPQLRTDLPKTPNGVPAKLPPPKAHPSGPSGLKAKTGKLPGAKPATAPAAPSVEAYAPYKGYNPANFGGASASNSQTKSNVQGNVLNNRGNVLHWARGIHQTQSGGY